MIVVLILFGLLLIFAQSSAVAPLKIKKYHPAIVWVVHIGEHIVFQMEEIARICKENGLILLEDCAHAHGASWNGKKPCTWGDAGIYSFYPTKTISTGEGGMLVTKNKKRDLCI